MIIDFDKIEEQKIQGFKGGKGELDTRNYVDDKCKIMKSVLKPGASSGLHIHEGNCEIVYVISGTATFHYDDTIETCTAGQVHYCPMNHSHYMENKGSNDLVYLAIVPEHH
ncbi:MAG: cupin domain-containing protein [Prevotella sp.]|jgi:quercetin dioxygenase-like cupin family protein|nr:cupin domain-containing protein [Prevotella sp.]MCI2079904.1 cupin domain-containing protein [Prevotella sp.]MCI2102548.1 cupin domain-containing protein [Prevotella sp.]